MNMTEKERKQYDRLKEKMLNAKNAEKVDYYADKIEELFATIQQRIATEEK